MGLPTLYTYAHSAPVLSSLVYLAGSCWQVAHDPSGAGGHHLVSRSLRPSCSATFSLSSSRRISFATVGMFSAVTNLGAGGLQDVSLSDTANGVLYATFALTGLISGGINNGSYASHQFFEYSSDHLVYFSPRSSTHPVLRQSSYPP